MGDGALAGLRVLDLATDRAELCGRTLAELGADVVKVEPPGGSSSRRLAPFAGDRSLYWEAVAAGKQSIVVDLAEPADRNELLVLLRAADVLIESFAPGELDSLGLGPENLLAENPRLVIASVTPYGQTGPKARWAASDLTIEASGGRLALQRDGSRPPVPVGHPQAAFHAGVQAAADVLVALNERAHSGRGQHLDVSMQAVMVHTIFSQASGALLNDATESVGTMDDPDADRAAKLRLLPGIWECADGFVAAPLTAGALPLVAHIMKVEEVDDDLAAYDWSKLVADVLRGRIDDDFVTRGTDVIRRFFAARTKAELYRLAHEGDFRLGPLQTTRDLVDDPHLRARRYWVDAGGFERPGPPVVMNGTPMLRGQRAPAVGDTPITDVRERWREAAPDAAAAAPAGGARSGEAFSGLRVADFSWVAVGPTIGRAFADHGATVVRVESEKRLDVARTLAPWKAGNKGINDSNWYAHYNAGKLGLALDLSTEDGRGIARELIDWADVVIESFSPGTMARLGLDYATVSKTNPALVMLSTSLLGQTGPMASFAGFGQQAVGLCGISTITGWPDRPPFPPMGAYTDVIAPKYGIVAIAAALLARERTGEGQHIDMSQVEASIRFIEPLLLDETVNGRTAQRPGLDSDRACPHGVYPLAGENRFIAVAVETDEQWQTLRKLAGGALDDIDATLDLAGRIERRDEIDRALAAWLLAQDPAEVDGVLAGAGVPAARAAKPAHVAHDPQLEHRQFFVELDHTAMGRCAYETPATRFSAKQALLHRPAPCLGEHTDMVLHDHLGFDHDRIAGLRQAGVLH